MTLDEDDYFSTVQSKNDGCLSFLGRGMLFDMEHYCASQLPHDFWGRN